MIGRIARVGLAAAVIASLLAFATQDPRPARLVLRPGSQLTIEGTSNLHDWSCTTSAIVADVRTQIDEGTIPAAVDFVSIEIPVDRIRCKNDKMDENLARALRAESHPRIVFRTTGSRMLPAPNATGRISGPLRGDLTVAGVTKTIDVPVQAVANPDGSLRITGSKPFLMTQFGIEPPTAMLGMIKTGNRITVRFELVASTADLAASRGADTPAR
jgi:polyisoprenoid-binding protein YceI